MKKLQDVVKEICAYGGCMAGYEVCGNEKGRANPTARLSLIGEAKVCPLAKYKVPYDNTPWYERSRIRLTKEDMGIVCDNCTHAINVKDSMELFESFCIDCPVKMVYDNIQECEAEAAIS